MKERQDRKRPRRQMIIRLLAMVLSVWTLAQPAAASNGDTLEMRAGRSEVVEAPWDVAQVSVAEPNIADVQVVRSNQIIVLAKTSGETDVIMWNEQGQTYHKVVRVVMDLNALTAQLNHYFPSASLEATQFGELVTVSGTFRRAEEAARLRSYLDATGMKYVDMTKLSGVQQVLIKIKIAEANRQALRSLGFDTLYAGEDFFGGSIINDLTTFTIDPTALGTPAAVDATIGNSTTLFGGIPDADLQTYIEALEENRYIRILAEPSLIALSGEEASFLAGGEFPIPVVQGSIGGGSTSITIEFKEFGVRLKFRPTVLGDGMIQLHVAPEVSSISDVGAVEIEGFSIPSLSTRRAETTLQLHSGQTFAMAGLLDQETRAQTQKVPGLGSVPVLGSLFRSVRYQNHDTEMVVLATVDLVEPISMVDNAPLPGDLHEQPSDWELYVNGRIESRTPRQVGPAGQQWMKDKGLDQLAGPGAWESSHGAASPQLAPPPAEPVAEPATEAMPEAADMSEPSEPETVEQPMEDGSQATEAAATAEPEVAK
ncbi:MAG: type II and III secretion system protein family protein [Phycisphaeraceae bacterium]|nr:type II and III secretion system protein family protein [Phycisphaeraceae bacterium]